MPVVYDGEAFSIKIVHAVVSQRIVLPVNHDVTGQPLPTGTQFLGAAAQTRVELVTTLLVQQTEGRVVITIGSEMAGILPKVASQTKLENIWILQCTNIFKIWMDSVLTRLLVFSDVSLYILNLSAISNFNGWVTCFSRNIDNIFCTPITYHMRNWQTWVADRTVKQCPKTYQGCSTQWPHTWNPDRHDIRYSRRGLKLLLSQYTCTLHIVL